MSYKIYNESIFFYLPIKKFPKVPLGNLETLTVGLSLQETVSNAQARETIGQIKQRAPSSYYTQNRMVNGQDYNKNLHSDIGAARDAGEDDISPAEKKKMLDKHKKKLISRLDSVEKLLRSHKLVESFGTASYFNGGSGAFEVFLLTH